MKQSYFIVGTDTGVGKTSIACKLLQRYSHQALTTIGFKPVASGCKTTPQGLRHDDALQLQQAASLQLPYQEVNPFALTQPLSPNIAAVKDGVDISVDKLVTHYQQLLTYQPEVIIIEGAGGWLCPINRTETLADFAIKLNLPVILVVAIKLGCLNHTLLTYHHIKQSGVPFAGWVANIIDNNELAINDNIATITDYLGEPMAI